MWNLPRKECGFSPFSYHFEDKVKPPLCPLAWVMEWIGRPGSGCRAPSWLVCTSVAAYVSSCLAIVGEIWKLTFRCFLSLPQHTACLCNAIIALLKVPLSFQRYFFQKLQSTSIKVRQAEYWGYCSFENQLLLGVKWDLATFQNLNFGFVKICSL